MSAYQMTGISFATAMECGDWLRGQGFVVASEGYCRWCELTGDLIEVSFTLTNGRCYLTMKHRDPREHPKHWRSQVDAKGVMDWFLDGNEEFQRGYVGRDAKGWFVEVSNDARAYRLTDADF